jgi:IS30 family transposase
LAQARKQQRVRPRITAAQWTQVEELLRQEWSPEQISGRLALEQQARISHERIYQYIYADKARGGTLSRHLRCRKVRRKRYFHDLDIIANLVHDQETCCANKGGAENG